ncbi:MAG: hypothetical protein J6W69_04385 [Bacteroidales bacterium]|nr:hypothetical protein [Bacteroidales bacterium]
MAQFSTTMLITLLITLWTSTLIRTLANITEKKDEPPANGCKRLVFAMSAIPFT